MRADKKLERDMAKLAAILSAAGKDDVAAELLQGNIPIKDDAHMHGEAVLLMLHNAIKFETRYCSREACAQPYMTNYRYQAYCSLHCVRRELAAIGVKFDPTKPPHERWGSQVGPCDPPLNVPPEAYKVIKRIVNTPFISPKQQSAEFMPPPETEENQTDSQSNPQVMVEPEFVTEPSHSGLPTTVQFEPFW